MILPDPFPPAGEPRRALDGIFPRPPAPVGQVVGDLV
jgi:hypothetical protein